MKEISLIIAVTLAPLIWDRTVAAADLEHECIRMTLPFTPTTDMNRGALIVVNASTPTAMTPLLIVAVLCSSPGDSKSDDVKAKIREKFINDEATTKARCVDAVDERVIQHSATFTERRFACMQSWSAEAGAPNRGFAASSLIEFDGHLLIVAYVNTVPRPDAEKQFDLIIGSLRSR